MLARRCHVRMVLSGSLLAAVLAGLFAPAGVLRAAEERPRLKVVTTVAMVGDVVRQVAGPHAEVVGLIGEGVDPHLYKATRNDVAQLQSADLVFYSGLLLEGRMSDTLVRLARGGRKVYAVTEKIDEKLLLDAPGGGGHHDPHVWMDAALWSQTADVVAEALAEADPRHAAEYRENAAKYRAELARLHEYIKRVVASIPERQRVLITAHDAFGYFGRSYGIEVRGIQGISTESEAGLDDINRLVDFIVTREIQAVFVESTVADKNVRALIEGARARGRSVKVGGTLYSDAMGSAGTYEGTYIGMLDHNATQIARALGGAAPAGGMQGKLASGKKD